MATRYVLEICIEQIWAVGGWACWAESEAIIFPIFTSPPLYGSHLSSSRGVRFIRLVCVFGVQTMLDTEIIYVCIRVYWGYIRVWCADNSVYGDWSPLAKILRPLKQSTSAVGRLQVCELLKGQILQSGASRLLVLTDHHSRNTRAHTVSSYVYTKLK